MGQGISMKDYKRNRRCLLDTSFILTCVKQKIPFLEEIPLMGIKILIPKQVIEEIKNITTSKKKLHFREDSELALRLIEKEKKSFKLIDLKTKNVDNGIINYADKNSRVIIATLDREIKNKTKNKKLVIRRKKKLEII